MGRDHTPILSRRTQPGVQHAREDEEGDALVQRPLELGCPHADEMLALLRRYSAWPAQKLCHEWGRKVGLRQASAGGLVPVSDAVRWWSITADLGSLDAQTQMVEELEVVDAPAGPHFHLDDLLQATRADRLQARAATTTMRRTRTSSIGESCARTHQGELAVRRGVNVGVTRRSLDPPG